MVFFLFAFPFGFAPLFFFCFDFFVVPTQKKKKLKGKSSARTELSPRVASSWLHADRTPQSWQCKNKKTQLKNFIFFGGERVWKFCEVGCKMKCLGFVFLLHQVFRSYFFFVQPLVFGFVFYGHLCLLFFLFLIFNFCVCVCVFFLNRVSPAHCSHQLRLK